MIDSRFIHLIRTDSNALFLRLSNIPLYICNTVEEEEGGMNGESSRETYITICKVASRNLLYDSGAQVGALWQYRWMGWRRGWEGDLRGRGHVILKADSCWCIAETTQHCKAIILQCKVNKFKKRKDLLHFESRPLFSLPSCTSASPASRTQSRTETHWVHIAKWWVSVLQCKERVTPGK